MEGSPVLKFSNYSPLCENRPGGTVCSMAWSLPLLYIDENNLRKEKMSFYISVFDWYSIYIQTVTNKPNKQTKGQQMTNYYTKALEPMPGLSVSQSVEADTIGDSIRMLTKTPLSDLDSLQHWHMRLGALIEELSAK